jgi:hypothetical protein
VTVRCSSADLLPGRATWDLQICKEGFSAEHIAEGVRVFVSKYFARKRTEKYAVRAAQMLPANASPIPAQPREKRLGGFSAAAVKMIGVASNEE